MRSPSFHALPTLGLVSSLGALALTLACSGHSQSNGTQAATVNAPPAITTQPAGLTVKVGDAILLSVKATGTPAPNYQWSKGGATIPGAISDTFSIPKAQATDDGSYTVTVTNSLGSVTSNPAVVAVNYPPVITTAPKDLTVSSGNGATFTVVADGKPAPTFQWKRNGTAIPGATAATYTFTTTPGDDGYLFTVDAINSLGTVTSSPAKLTVTTVSAKPTFVSDLADVSASEGKDAVFSVVVTGNTPLTYTWFVNGAQVTTGTNASYTLPAVKLADTGKLVKVTVSNPAGSATSREAKLTVTPAGTSNLKDGEAEWVVDAAIGAAIPKDGDLVDDAVPFKVHFHSAVGWEKDSNGNAYFGYAVDKLDGKGPFESYWASQDPTKTDITLAFKIGFVSRLGLKSGQKIRLGLWGAPKGSTDDVFSGWVNVTVK